MSVWEISWKYHENITSRIQDIYAQYPWWHVDIRWAPPLRPFLQGIAEPQNPTVDPPLLVSPKISGRWMFIPPKWCIYIYILYIYYNIYIYNPVLFDSKMHNLGGFFANGSLRRIFWGLKKSQWISTDHCTGCRCGENPGFWKHKQKRFPMVPVIFHLNHVWDTNHSKRWNTWPPKRWEMLSSAW